MDEPMPAVLSGADLSGGKSVALKDKIAVVTGGASGIGRAISLRLAREGCHVAIWDRDISGAPRVGAEVGELGRRMLPVEVDVSSFADVERAADRVHRELGKASILVNNAGYGEIVAVAQMSEA